MILSFISLIKSKNRVARAIREFFKAFISLILILNLTFISPMLIQPTYAGSCGTCCSGRDKDKGMKDSYCTAAELSEVGEQEDLKTGIAYTAAAAVCATACVLQFTAVATGHAIAACNAVGLLAFGLDIWAGVTLKKKNDQSGFDETLSMDRYMNGKNPDTIGEISADANKPDTDETESEEDAAILGGVGSAAAVGGGVAARLAAKQAANNAAKLAAKKLAAKVAICFAAAFYGSAASIKWVNYTRNRDNKDKLCTEANKLCPAAPETPVFDNRPHTGGGGDNSDNGNNGTMTPDIKKSEDKAAAAAEAIFSDSQSSAAMADPLLRGLDRGEFKKAMDELGLNMKDLAHKLTSGSPSAAIASMVPSLPNNLKQSLAEVEQLAKDGQISWPGLDSTYTGGGGGGGAADGGMKMPDFGGLFGNKAEDKGPGTQDITFGQKSKNVLDPNNTDIWHSQWKGSIFQIVSQKLETNQKRVEKLEWASPLNRALMGLPKK